MRRNEPPRIGLWIALLTVLALVAAACSTTSSGEGEAISSTTQAAAPTTDGGESSSPTTSGEPSDQESPGDDSGESILRVAVGQEPVNTHPPLLRLSQDRIASSLVYNGLVKYDMPTTEIVPDLATDWTISDDGLTYTFNLNEGVQFHGGYGEMTASDVAFTIDYLRDPDNAASVGPLFSVVDSVTAVDDYTVEIQLSQPFNQFMDILAWQNALIMSEAAVSELGDELALAPIGTGPYQFVERIPGQSLSFEAFDEYFEGPPPLDGVTLSVIPSELTQVLSIQNGELDASLISSIASLETASSLDNVQAKMNDSSTWVYIAHPNCRPDRPTADPEIRRALMHAYNTDALAAASNGFLTPLVTFLNPRTFGYTTDVPTYPYDPELARSLLEEAGYDGTPIGIMFTGSYLYEDLAQIMKQGFEEAGVVVELQKVEAAVTTQRAVEGEFDIWVSAAARGTPEEYMSPYFTVGGPRDYGLCATEELTAEIQEARTLLDPEAAEQAYVEIQREIMEDVFIMPLGLQGSAWAIGDRVNPDTFNFDGFSAVVDLKQVELNG